MHLVLFPRQHLPDLPPLALDHSHAPDLLRSPRISQTVDLHLNDIALHTLLLPARLEVVVCIELGKLDDPSKSQLAQVCLQNTEPGELSSEKER
jgi:hypothetical protein